MSVNGVTARNRSNLLEGVSSEVDISVLQASTTEHVEKSDRICNSSYSI